MNSKPTPKYFQVRSKKFQEQTKSQILKPIELSTPEHQKDKKQPKSTRNRGEPQLQRLFEILQLKLQCPQQMIHFFMKMKMDQLSQEQTISSFQDQQSKLKLLQAWQAWRQFQEDNIKQKVKISLIQKSHENNLLKLFWNEWIIQKKKSRKPLGLFSRSASKKINSQVGFVGTPIRNGSFSERRSSSKKNVRRVSAPKQDLKEEKSIKKYNTNLKRRVMRCWKRIMSQREMQQEQTQITRQNIIKREIFFNWYLALEDLRNERQRILLRGQRFVKLIEVNKMNKIIIRIVIIYKEDMEGDEIIMCGIGEKNEQENFKLVGQWNY